jgi:hypothetical protein
VSAGEFLEHTWTLARSALADHIGDDALDDVDRRLAAAELPMCADVAVDRSTRCAVQWRTPIIDDWHRGWIVMTTVAATWHRVVFCVNGGAITRFITVPGREIDEFVERLQRGDLDDWLHATTR